MHSIIGCAKNTREWIQQRSYIENNPLGLVPHLGLGGEEDSDDETKKTDGTPKDLHNQNLWTWKTKMAI